MDVRENRNDYTFSFDNALGTLMFLFYRSDISMFPIDYAELGTVQYGCSP